MITSTSKNNSFPCVREVCGEQIIGCLECKTQVEQQAHPRRKYLRDLWINIRLFLGTDRWDRAVTLQRGDSHYTIKMDDIEARWRNQ